MRKQKSLSVVLLLSAWAGSMLLGCSAHNKVKTGQATSKRETTIVHKLYDIPKGSYTFFSDKDKLEKMLSMVSTAVDPELDYRNCDKKDVLKVLRATDKAIEKVAGSYKEHKMDCNNMSLVYISVGRRYNIPIFGVSAPGHFFVRYDPNGKHDSLNEESLINKGDFNWEATEGIEVSDRDYIIQKNISETSIRSGSYMRNLPDSELPGDIYSEMGIQAFRQRNWDEAIELFEKSITFNPLDAGAYFNKGSAIFNKRAREKSPEKDLTLYSSSLESLTRSIELDPNNIAAYYFRGCLYMDKENEMLAASDFEICLDLASRSGIDRLLKSRAKDKLHKNTLHAKK